MGGTRAFLWDKWLLSGGMVVVGFLLPRLSDSSVFCHSVPFVRTNNFLTKIQATTRSATVLNNGLRNMSLVLTIKPQLWSCLSIIFSCFRNRRGEAKRKYPNAFLREPGIKETAVRRRELYLTSHFNL